MLVFIYANDIRHSLVFNLVFAGAFQSFLPTIFFPEREFNITIDISAIPTIAKIAMPAVIRKKNSLFNMYEFSLIQMEARSAMTN